MSSSGTLDTEYYRLDKWEFLSKVLAWKEKPLSLIHRAELRSAERHPVGISRLTSGLAKREETEGLDIRRVVGPVLRPTRALGRHKSPACCVMPMLPDPSVLAKTSTLDILLGCKPQMILNTRVPLMDRSSYSGGLEVFVKQLRLVPGKPRKAVENRHRNVTES